jgi:Tol biopolymer transport system component
MGRTSLTYSFDIKYHPRCSPDGKNITYSSDKELPGGGHHNYIMDTDGTQETVTQL